MRGPEGDIRIKGFYDEVIPLAREEREEIAAVPFDESAYKKQLGVNTLFGEPGYTTRERAWVRPTLEVNGIWGGFQGEGVKTVLPAQAHAKITCRLVPDQRPAHIVQCLTEHVETHTPPGVSAAVTALPMASPAYVIPPDHPGNRAARAVLQDLYGKTPYNIRLGGTLPVCSYLLTYLQVYTVIFAFGLEDENPHAPDEFFRLTSFDRGQTAYCKLFEQLGLQKDLR